MLTLSRNHDIMGLFEDKSTMQKALFGNSNLTVPQINKLLDEDRVELSGCVLIIEEFKENDLEYFSQHDVILDMEESFLDDLDLMDDEDFEED